MYCVLVYHMAILDLSHFWSQIEGTMGNEGDHSLTYCQTINTVSRAAADQEAANDARILMEERCDRDEGRLVAAPFLVKTYRFVDDPSTDRIVSWGHHDKTFVVWRPREFSTCILPGYFNHTNFSSFVRQLNTYGFRKVVRGRFEFAHELFRKGQKHLLCHIQRRKSCTTSATKAREMVEHDKTLSLIPTSPSTAPDSDAPVAAASLLEENEMLKRNNSLLLSEIARLQNICTAISRSLFGTTAGMLLNGSPLLIDNATNRRMDNLSRSSFMADVGEENNTNPPELFGVRLY